MNHMTLDGVMQGPGRADEDTRDGFTQGGWGRRSVTPDDAVGEAMGAIRRRSGDHGSGVLIGALMAAYLIDEFLLMIHPLVLGTERPATGQRACRDHARCTCGRRGAAPSGGVGVLRRPSRAMVRALTGHRGVLTPQARSATIRLIPRPSTS